MTEKLLKIEELAVLTNTSVQTINNWYRWKKLNPNHELAKKLPDYTQNGERQTRYWKQSDVWTMLEFKSILPKGRKGILGEVTQRGKRRNK